MAWDKNKQLVDNANTFKITAQTGTAYTLVLTDKGKLVTMTNASANVLTVPANATVAFATGTVIVVKQGGAGVTTITASAGVTLNDVVAGSGAILAQYYDATLIKTATNTWVVSGTIGSVV